MLQKTLNRKSNTGHKSDARRKIFRELSLETAMALFKTKILLILTYGIEVIWTHLNERPLATIKSVI